MVPGYVGQKVVQVVDVQYGLFNVCAEQLDVPGPCGGPVHRLVTPLAAR